ncbi:MAG: POTRA domain-containing protein, partial [Burkholderiaceae bacterium]|nr:POTRA domain-containing protein [Burkholderiaceae bacterium]
MLKNKIVCIALLTAGQYVLAADPPSAGGQLQQIPLPPSLQRDVPEIRVAPPNAPVDAAADATKVMVRSLRVTGQTHYSEAELLSITGFVPGTELNLRDLRGMAWRISDYLHRNGYVVAQAFLPAQEIRDGVVTIQVMEGRYGAIRLRNESGLDNALPDGLLGGLNAGDPILIAPLENRLLLLSDIPGVSVQSTLAPGASVGTSDLLIDVKPGRRVTGSVEADNAGNRYTGANRVGATVYINNPTGNGDVLGFRGLTSGSGLVYGRASYQIQTGKAKIGVAFASLRYELGREFASLDANGSAQIASLYGSYPLIRSRNTNLYALVDLDLKKFQDKVDSTGLVTDKRAQVLTASLNGNFRDQVGGGGLSNYWLA